MSASLRTQTRRWGSAILLPMKTPIERLFDQVAWEVLPPIEKQEGLYATHRGVLDLGGVIIPCYRLNNGQAMIEESAIEELFPGWKDIFKQMGEEIPPTIKFTP